MAYDPATQWLLDTMHDPKVSLRHRIDCAKTLLEIHPQEFNVRWVQDPDAPMIKIIIEGISAEQHPPGLADQDQVRSSELPDPDNHSPAQLN